MAKSDMTPEEQKLYEQFQDMFNHPAWAKYIERVTEMKNNIMKSTPYKIDTELGLGEVRGAVEAFDMTLYLEATMTQNAEDSGEEEAADE